MPVAGASGGGQGGKCAKTQRSFSQLHPEKRQLWREERETSDADRNRQEAPGKPQQGTRVCLSLLLDCQVSWSAPHWHSLRGNQLGEKMCGRTPGPALSFGDRDEFELRGTHHFKLSVKKTPDSDEIVDKFHQILKNEIMLLIPKHPQRIKSGNISQLSPEASVYLDSKS